MTNAQQGVELGGASGLRNLDVVLQRGAASLAGQVRTWIGAPVPGISLYLSCQEGQSSTSTGPDGRYRLGSLTPGGTCHLSARGDRFNGVEATVEVKAGENHLDLQLVPIETVEIRGRVIGPASEPVAGAEVEIRSALDGKKHLTAPDGSFAVETFAGSSDCGLSVWKDGYAAYRSQNVPCGEAPAKAAVPAWSGRSPCPDVSSISIRSSSGASESPRSMNLSPTPVAASPRTGPIGSSTSAPANGM